MTDSKETLFSHDCLPFSWELGGKQFGSRHSNFREVLWEMKRERPGSPLPCSFAPKGEPQESSQGWASCCLPSFPFPGSSDIVVLCPLEKQGSGSSSAWRFQLCNVLDQFTRPLWHWRRRRGGGSERQRRGWGVGDRMLHELVKHKAGVGKALKCNRAGSGKNKQTNGEEEEEGGWERKGEGTVSDPLNIWMRGLSGWELSLNSFGYFRRRGERITSRSW